MLRLPRVLLISFTDHARDPRVHRQIQALSGQPLELCTAGTGAAAQTKHNHTFVVRRRRGTAEKLLRAAWLKARMFERYYWDMPMVVDAWNKLQGKD